MRFKEVKKTVKAVLETDRRARNSDNYLYARVCNQFNPMVMNMSFGYVLDNMKDLGVPKFETVRRARQKAQEDFPELAADKDVEACRKVLETEYRNFARSVI